MYLLSEDMLYIGVYVDDIILAGKMDEQLQTIKDHLSREFDIKDLGRLQYFLGMMKVIQDTENKSIWIGQPAYIQKIFSICKT